MPICRSKQFRLIAVAALLASNSASLHACPTDVWVWAPCLQAPRYTQSPNSSLPATRKVPAQPRLAQPTAAPPSADKLVSQAEVRPPVAAPPKPAVSESTPAEPRQQHGVAVREEGPAYDSYPIVLKEKPINDQCTVTFQNLSGRALKIIVDSRDQELAEKQTVTLPVRREFIWRVEGREPQKEVFGKNDYALQIVLRR